MPGMPASVTYATRMPALIASTIHCAPRRSLWACTARRRPAAGMPACVSNARVPAGVFRGDEVGVAQRVDRARREVAEIADRGGNEHETGGCALAPRLTASDPSPAQLEHVALAEPPALERARFGLHHEGRAAQQG